MTDMVPKGFERAEYKRLRPILLGKHYDMPPVLLDELIAKAGLTKERAAERCFWSTQRSPPGPGSLYSNTPKVIRIAGRPMGRAQDLRLPEAESLE